MYLTMQSTISNQQTFKLVEYKGKWFWDNNLLIYSDEEYNDRKSHETKDQAIEFAKSWAKNTDDVIKWIQLDGVTIKEL